MQRRSFLKTITGALLVPCVQLRKEVDRESLMLAFCDEPEMSRWDLDRPFSIGSLTYATDARHMVRAELTNRLDCGERRLPPRVEEAWNRHWNPSGDWRPFELPPIESLTMHPEQRNEGICPACGDRYISLGDTYPSEEEVGVHYRYLGYDVDTNSIRDPSCCLCNGRPYHGPHCLEVCGVLMSYHRLKPIAAIPGVMIAPNLKGTRNEPVLFRGYGIDGMAMGLN